ncbi:hypothetical protein IQ226_19355 [Dolichospermum sp. LEGE 00240]|uniref:hypothetical protein n=1 Tax=Dolichospermum sp. LEGE 00240 TaxID=1828603 RepID=UPI0018813278|nr:hypothetical protein [Dolichospermum sp. LEGE 00240]MBE9251248.1 hypothetical protein [Dolichospermum sp. LEGE 00240]
MRFKYSTSHPSQNEFDSLPRVPLVLLRGDQIVEALGLVDSGVTINVLPYEIGLQLGGVWDENKAIIQLAGNISQAAMPSFANAEIGEFPSVRLAFAWVSKPNAPLILGQTNFFMEFDVSFYRSQLEFEIKPKS